MTDTDYRQAKLDEVDLLKFQLITERLARIDTQKQLATQQQLLLQAEVAAKLCEPDEELKTIDIDAGTVTIAKKVT